MQTICAGQKYNGKYGVVELASVTERYVYYKTTSKRPNRVLKRSVERLIKKGTWILI